MVFAMPEGRNLSKMLVTLGIKAEFLSKDRMGNSDIIDLVSAVRDTDAGIARLAKEVLEVGADPLYRRRVYGCGAKFLTDTLDPNARYQSDLIPPQ